MIESRQKFLKGINRRFPRDESSNPEFFYTLQNARIFNRGDTGKVQRIDGYSDFVTTGNDYTNTLDFVDFKNHYVVLYEDATISGTYHVEIFDTNGTSINSFSYTGEDLSEGSLTKSDNTIFISPHNKVLFYQNGSWTLEDFTSEVPSVDGTNEDTSGVGKASATIEPTSTPSTTNLEDHATAQISVKKNNTAIGRSDTFTVTVGSNTTGQIEVFYYDTEMDIAHKIYWALRGENGYTDPGVTTEWDVSLSKESLDTFKRGSTNIYLTALNATSARNSDTIALQGSNYTINDPTNPFDRPIQLDPEYTEGINRVVNDQVSTININQPSGGTDGSNSFIGSLHMRFNNINHTVGTENVISSDTISDIADKIETALTGDPTITDAFTISRSLDVITIESKEFGKKYNGKLTLKFQSGGFVKASDIISLNKTNFSGGQDVDPNLALQKETNYWYKARYKYLDGHISEDCFPIRINTGQNNMVTITFNTPDLDLDGSRPKLQIFRKTEGNEFFLIDEIDVSGITTDFIDEGKLESGGFQDEGLTWTKTHKAQTILDGRYVRANITYNEEEYTITDSSFSLSTTSTTSEESLPSNSKASFYVQPQYIDGTKGYFEPIGQLDVNTPGEIPTIQQSEVLTNSDKTIDELGFYVNYKPHGEEHTYQFNSIELANPNVPTIQDSNFFPTRTRVFFGFKYLEVWGGQNHTGVFKIAGWDASGEAREHGGFAYDTFDDSGPINGNFPQKLTVEIFGLDFEYIRHGYRDTGSTSSNNAVYKLADFESLKKAIATGDLEIRLLDSNVGTLSTEVADDNIYGTKVKVKSLIDKSSQYDDLSILDEQDDVLIGPLDSRIYLELESSILDEIDNKNVSQYSLKRNYEDYETGIDLLGIDGFPTTNEDLSSYTLSFELTNFKFKTSASFNTYTGDEANYDGGRPETTEFNATMYRYDWDDSVYELITSDFLEGNEALVFIGRKENELSTVTYDVTGLEFKDDREIQYNRLLESNIYSEPIFSQDLNLNLTDYGTQLIWSDPLRTLNGFSGGRTFKPEAFFNIGNENGDIIEIESLANKLYVFCENGLAVVNVGEVLTTQKDGEVFVDSSTFMTNYFWINDKLVDVKRESITKYKNTVYFTDGYDVYSLTQQGLQNLTQGIIELDPTKDYYGGINPEHSEYQLCDYNQNETWVYNLEFEQWYGPFTYKFTNSDYIRHQFITVDDSLYEHDSSNTFDGTSYTTLIQSVANDTEQSFYDKNFRKFYIQTQNDTNTTFKYGKESNSLVGKSISNMKVKNGYKHQGITPTESNSKSIFWDIETTDDNFELSDLTYSFSPNRRR